MPYAADLGLPPVCRVGLAGTGFLGQGAVRMLQGFPGEIELGKVLTRRPLDSKVGIDVDRLTASAEELAADSDLVLECSGDVYHAAEVVKAAHDAGKPVLTMDSEFQVTVGSHFCGTGFISEGEGDQPGSLASLCEEVTAMGFEPLVLGNIKGFLNHLPTLGDMEYWSRKNGISLTQVTSFTDGTKMQIEQALVANGLRCGILEKGLVGPTDLELDEVGALLGARALEAGGPVVDYILNGKVPPGVFVTCTHDFEDREVLRYLKLGGGPCYTLLRPYHLCHLEMMKTIRRIKEGRGALLTNSETPKMNVVAIAKHDFKAGDRMETGIGGFDVRGEVCTFAEEPDAVPIGLLDETVLLRDVEEGQTLAWTDVEVRPGLARDAAWGIQEKVRAFAS